MVETIIMVDSCAVNYQLRSSYTDAYGDNEVIDTMPSLLRNEPFCVTPVTRANPGMSAPPESAFKNEGLGHDIILIVDLITATTYFTAKLL